MDDLGMPRILRNPHASSPMRNTITATWPSPLTHTCSQIDAQPDIGRQHLHQPLDIFLTSNFGGLIKDNLCLCVLGSTWDWGVLPQPMQSSNNLHQSWPEVLELKQNPQYVAWFSIRHLEKHDVLGKRPLWCLALIQVPGWNGAWVSRSSWQIE